MLENGEFFSGRMREERKMTVCHSHTLVEKKVQISEHRWFIVLTHIAYTIYESLRATALVSHISSYAVVALSETYVLYNTL